MARSQILLKSKEEIAIMAQAGAIVCEVLDAVEAHVAPGVTTLQLDEIAHDVMRSRGASSAFLGYPSDSGGSPFPGVLCTSVNDAIVHGIPSADQVLACGDIVSVDFGCVFEGFYGDSARTLAVGEVSAEVAQLLEITQRALAEAISQCKVDRRLHEIGAAVERIVKPFGYGIVRDFVGHGIGRDLHEDPQVPNYVPHGYKPVSGPRLRPGMVLAIEPMLNLGTGRTKRTQDGWTITTADGSMSAHFEHTVAITENGPIVLTSRK